jgi:hypothetical protein
MMRVKVVALSSCWHSGDLHMLNLSRYVVE